jgi:hypothetical protein
VSDRYQERSSVKSRTEATMRGQGGPLLALVWRALESGTGSGNVLEAEGACPAYAVPGIDSAFPGIDRQHTPRGRPS